MQLKRFAPEPHGKSLSDAARRLRIAYESEPLPPLRKWLAPSDLAAAYQVQDLNTAFWCAGGREVAGFKIGLTAAAVREALQVTEPDAGVLFADRRVETGGRIMSRTLLQPRVEGEIALVLARDLDGEVDATTLTAALAGAAAAIEVVDSRVADWQITAADTIADNGSAGLYVVGPLKRDLTGIDLSACGMQLSVDGVVQASGTGANTMGSPLRALAWLARHRARTSRPLKAGDIVLTGALAPMLPFAPGTTISVEVSGFGAASVTLDG